MQRAVIIGGGLGGLVSGALLAKRGYHVVLLEQHSVVGGCATTYRRANGYRCEVGLHMINSPYAGDDLQRILAHLGVFDAVEFIRVPEFYEVRRAGQTFVMPFGAQEAHAALAARFPAQRAALGKLFATFEAIEGAILTFGNLRWWNFLRLLGAIRTVMKFHRFTIGEYLDSLFDDADLKTVLCANLGYYHDRADELSLLYFVMAQYGYLKHGGYFIKGGSQRLSDYLASVITAHGGEVRTRTLVERIEVNGERATQVVATRKNQIQAYPADWVIANASPFQVYAQLLPAQYRDPAIAAMPTSISLVAIFLGFKKSLRDVYGAHSYTLALEMDAPNAEPACRDFLFTDYSQLDSGLTDPGNSFAALAAPGYLEEWAELSEEAYQAKKARVLAAYLDRLEREFPGIGELVEFADVGTPRTMKRYLMTERGAVYGFAPTPQQAARRFSPKSKTVRNLRFVGAWAFGGGFSPAIMSGYASIRDLVGEL